MWEDPIVNETRRLRSELSREFNDDQKALLDYIREQTKKRAKKTVSHPPRPATPQKKAN